MPSPEILSEITSVLESFPEHLWEIEDVIDLHVEFVLNDSKT